MKRNSNRLATIALATLIGAGLLAALPVTTAAQENEPPGGTYEKVSARTTCQPS